VLLAAGVESGLNRPFVSGSDSSQYASIGASLAHGGGYRDPVGLWPNSPATDRVPAWPIILSFGMRLAPNAPDEVVSRLTNIFCLALVGVFMGALCRKLGVRPLLCLLAGLYVSLSPILAYFALDGLSEISFILLVTAGLFLLFASRRFWYLGALLIGMGPLIRPNFVIVPVLFIALVVLLPAMRRRTVFSSGVLIRATLALILSMVPTIAWLLRNYTVTGRFPLLTTFYGEAYYGSNNDVTANDLEYWGGWTFPDAIPNETPKKVLAQHLPNDVALNDYYIHKGNQWVETHRAALPRLLLGKAVRSFALIPWDNSTSWRQWSALSSRMVLLLLVLVTIPFWWHAMNRYYLVFLLALGISHIVTTILIDGQVRYSFCFFELFALPCAAFGVDRWLQGRQAAAFARSCNSQPQTNPTHDSSAASG